MKDFRPYFKQLAQTRQLTASCVIYRALLIATETDDPVTCALQLIKKSFTPVTKKSKLDNGRTPYDSVANAIKWAPIGALALADEFLETPEELKKYKELRRKIWDIYIPDTKTLNNRFYTYIFVRQDISSEYQAVQACHAAAKMGHRTGMGSVSFTMNQFDELYFALIGVPDLPAMAVAMNDCKKVGAEVYPFYEPDIGNVMTAFATSPIRMSERKRLLSYEKLRFKID